MEQKMKSEPRERINLNLKVIHHFALNENNCYERGRCTVAYEIGENICLNFE